MGSIKVGKDADIVIWSNNPLSIYAKVIYTYVDGVCYFDTQKDEQLRITVKQERERILSQMISEKANGEKTEKTISIIPEKYTCDTDTDYGK